MAHGARRTAQSTECSALLWQITVQSRSHNAHRATCTLHRAAFSALQRTARSAHRTNARRTAAYAGMGRNQPDAPQRHPVKQTVEKRGLIKKSDPPIQ